MEGEDDIIDLTFSNDDIKPNADEVKSIYINKEPQVKKPIPINYVKPGTLDKEWINNDNTQVDDNEFWIDNGSIDTSMDSDGSDLTEEYEVNDWNDDKENFDVNWWNKRFY